jgi:DNA-binding CsgD family transcriptional regulator
VREALTSREYEIFRLMGRGMLSKEIGDALGISPLTVQSHRKKIAQKLGTTGNELLQQAVRYHEKNLETAR